MPDPTPSTSPVPTSSRSLDRRLEDLAGRASERLKSARADNTVRAYRSDWRAFTSWCDELGLQALPAEPSTVVLYLEDQVGERKLSTLERRLSSISVAHQAAGLATPTQTRLVRDAWRALRRTVDHRPAKKAPVTVPELRRMVRALPDNLHGIRDRALLLVGFASALRRAELVALDVEALEEREEGLVLYVGRSKNDQEGAGREVGVPYGSNPETCPVRAVRAWLAAAELERGALFRSISPDHVVGERLSSRGVARVIKSAVKRVGLDPDRYGGHSLRSGLATAAAAAGAPERAIMAQTGHRDLRSLRGYIHSGGLFRENAAASVGL